MVYCPAPHHSKPSSCQTLDYREKAPSGATRDMYLKDGKPDASKSQDGALAIGVPGVPAGLLTMLDRFGTFPRSQLLKWPIRAAIDGYKFSGHEENVAGRRWSAFNDSARKIFGCGGSPCSVGTVIRQPELAHVLEAIASHGAKGFYSGWVARKIVDGVKKGGGILSLEDLASYHPELRAPVVGSYRGFEIISMPPPSSGGAILLQLLKYMELADRSGALRDGHGSASSMHALAHAMALAFADRSKHFGDPGFYSVPLQGMLADAYVADRWKLFDARKKVEIPGPGLPGAGEPGNEPMHTTHFSVIDRHGNAVSITTTVNDDFGSGFVPPGTGVVMNNEMDDFSAAPGIANLYGLVGGEANAIAPAKRPLSSMTPTIVRDPGGHTKIVIGAAGGPRIITSVFQSLVNRLRFGLSLPEAVAAPRLHFQWKPDVLKLEARGFSLPTLESLHALGYKTEEAPALGRIHALERFESGRVWGVADPRAEGAAVAE